MFVSSVSNHKTSRGPLTDHYNQKASGGRSRRQIPVHVVRSPTLISEITLFKFNKATHGVKIYKSQFRAEVLFPAATILTSVFNHHSFHLMNHIFPSLTFITVFIINQFWSHNIQKSLLGSSLVLSVFWCIAFHYSV